MNHRLWGYYFLFGITLGELKGPDILRFSQHMEF